MCDYIHLEINPYYLYILSLYTAIRPRGHSRQARASSVSSRQKKEGIIVQRFKVK